MLETWLRKKRPSDINIIASEIVAEATDETAPLLKKDLTFFYKGVEGIGVSP